MQRPVDTRGGVDAAREVEGSYVLFFCGAVTTLDEQARPATGRPELEPKLRGEVRRSLAAGWIRPPGARDGTQFGPAFTIHPIVPTPSALLERGGG